MQTSFATHHATPIGSVSPAGGGVVTRADRTVLPVRISGFGAIMEKEHDLKAATALALVREARRSEVAEMLRSHQVRIEANLTLLGQRYQMLPRSGRFDALDRFTAVPDPEALTAERPKPVTLLPLLLALHDGLAGDIEQLYAERRDGQRGEMILSQVTRNHEHMAGEIAAVLAHETAGDSSPFASPPAEPAPRAAGEAIEHGGDASPRVGR